MSRSKLRKGHKERIWKRHINSVIRKNTILKEYERKQMEEIEKLNELRLLKEEEE